jgi:purine-nucleoside/S-methyl-5'-thioadenosine phosphorylase / adenosine deaminase
MTVKTIKLKTDTIMPVNWPVENVQAFTTTRHHPFSQDRPQKNRSSFSAFNLGDHVGDDLTAVEQNRQALLKLLPKGTKIQWLKQVHGNNTDVLTQHSPEAIEADAIITSSQHIALTIMTADCLPILLADMQGNEIAAIHGGWRPLVQDIIANTIEKMITPASNICAWLGPCIGNEVFEVGDEVKQAFVKKSAIFASTFKPIIKADNKKDKFLADLHAIAKIQLQQLGVRDISTLSHCTYSLVKNYYSYRRENITGRMASVICRL